MLILSGVSRNCIRFPLRRFSTSHHVSDLRNQLKEFSTQQIIFTFNTLARSGVRDWNLWHLLCEHVKPQVKYMHVDDVLQVVHSLAKIAYKKISLLNVINSILLNKNIILSTRQTTQYLIDLKKLDILDPNTFISLVTPKLNEEIDLFSAFDLCFIIHICSKLQIADTFIIQSTSAHLLSNKEKLLQVLKDKILVIIVLRSLAFLESPNELFNHLLYERLPSCIYNFGTQELCNSLFALVLSHLELPFHQISIDVTNAILDAISMDIEHLVNIEVNQLQICLYYLKYNFSAYQEKHEKLLNEIDSLQLRTTPSSSKMQGKVGKLLDEMRIKHQSEMRIGPYTLDYAIVPHKVAIEVNGYTHFYHQTTRMNANTRLKYKILQSMGWNVCSINYFDWKNKGKQEKLEYLSRELKPLLTICC
ncbi:bifunctional RAP domain/Restriction endonuclease type II-like [Babesia duncani]|uniref:Bifunctional RAP domain/Restriction endonuclease type II-like n=1 Tax=Babesia duncani TaxID=323732 RepID=A0AAD9UQ87_9APIC|nr:bifunctional RAP domain/Restriction endonuclease type II-like [Babesia duncani]